MTSFSFRYGPKVTSGPASSNHLVDLIEADGILFVTDTQIVSLGLQKPSVDALTAAGRRVVMFDAVEADPHRHTLEAAVELGRREKVGAVIGFGGGSPMDVAKLAAYLLGSNDDLDRIWGVGAAVGPKLPLVLVPTTAGTGSEATPVAIISLDGGEKRGVSSASLTADHAVLDPDLTTTLPRAVTAATGIDAMVHAIEAYTSLHLKNPVSDLLAREALRMLSANLVRACETPGDLEARQAMLLGSHLAGVAFSNAPVGGVHALAYPLGGRFHVPHGLSNALMLPHVLAFNMEAAMSCYSELAMVIDPTLGGLPPERQARTLPVLLNALIERTGLPRRLSDLGIGRTDLETLAADAMAQERLLRNNPCRIDQADALALYERAL